MRLKDIPRHLLTRAQVAVHRLRHGAEPMFTYDWTTTHRQHWLAALAPFRDKPIRILEIGSFEGRSARFLLDTFPEARITCVDTFSPKRSAKFDHNLGPHRAAVTKIAGRSAAILDRLVVEKRRYEVIYIDGDHKRASVLADSVLAWPLLTVGGVLIWDDYLLAPEKPSHERPQHAIDVFCDAFRSCIREMHRDYQVIISKTAEWPTPAQHLHVA